MIFNRPVPKLYVLLLLAATATAAFPQANRWAKYELYLGDTINKVDQAGLRQGRWVYFGKDKKNKQGIFKSSQIAEEGYYVNDRKFRTWKTYHSTGRLRSAVTYYNDRQRGMVKFYDTDGKLQKAGIMENNAWIDNYYVYDSRGNKHLHRAPDEGSHSSCLEFSGNVNKLGKDLDGVTVTVEKNGLSTGSITTGKDGAFALTLELNEDYLVYFSRKGFEKQSLLVNTHVSSYQDTSVYRLKNWKISMSDNLATSATNEFFSFLLNKPSGRIYFNSKKKEFISDGKYVHIFKKEFGHISESTKALLSKAAEDNARLEIENLRIEAENKAKEIELLQKNKDLQDAELRKKEEEIRREKLEKEKQEQGLALLEKERQIQDLNFRQQQAVLLKQQLEAERKAREIEQLNYARQLQELELQASNRKLDKASSDLNKTQNELFDKIRESSLKEKENKVLTREKEVKERELKQGRAILNVALAGIVLILLFLFVLYRNYSQKKKHNLVLKKQSQEIAAQKEEIEEKNKDITDSINYAKRIQEAMLPAKEIKYRIFPNAFVLLKPKDIVSGDFYWFAEKNGKRIIAAVDCTGHGVPGAFMSMIGNNFLHQIVAESGVTRPGDILGLLNERVREALKQKSRGSESRDGMDIALCAFAENGAVEYAGAQRPLWIVRNDTLEEIKPNKVSIGGLQSEGHKDFTNHHLELAAGDCAYIFSDGYADQFGGEKGKKFMTKNFKSLLLALKDKTMPEQENILDNTIESWRGERGQVDDILVIGVRV